MFFPLIYFLILSFLFSCSSTGPVTQNVCSGIIVHSEEEIEFTEDEIRLACGDKQTEAYKEIPPYQSSFFLTGFLQSRGYTNPKFETIKNVLHVYPQEKTVISKVKLNFSDTDHPVDDSDLKKTLEKTLFKHHRKEELSPKTLNAIEAETLSLLRNASYACAKVESTALADTGEINLKITNLKKYKFGHVEREPIEGIYNEAFERFNSFSEIDHFREDELTLTEKRYLRSEIVQATFFVESCNPDTDTLSLKQKFIVGDPRTIRFGIGASTEVGPMIRIKWSDLRHGNMASRREAQLQTSFKTQSLNFYMEQFLWKDSPRRSLISELIVQREDQKTYEELTAELKSHLQWTRDNWSRFWQWSAGPTLISSRFETNDDIEDHKFTAVALEGELMSQTHSYEVFDIHPEEGEFYQLNLDGRHKALGFDEPLLKMDWTIVKLLRLWNIGKGVGIIGGRMNAGSTWVADNVNLRALPPSVKHYGGGSDDIRGFDLNSLPGNNGLGALTKFSAKLEFRKTYVFTSSLESFAFIDAAYFGKDSWQLDDQLYYSPGTGLRWLSPIGLVQTYLARTLSSRTIKDDGFFYYIGLGGIF